jgi:hypothetical protein
MTFDPQCDFLLRGDCESLFETAGRNGYTLRCKGCREVVNRWDRLEHGQNHVIERVAAKAAERIANLAAARAARKEKAA